ncbi:MAG: [Fe-Fe] hydrogenase large subunit C-terminal domain-containing protein [Bacteroidales bacterium]
MEQRINKTEFHHALRVQEDICTGCSHCLRVCPTDAVRIRNGKSHISENKCIDCGECYRACPVSAIHVEQDDLQGMFGFRYRVALIPSVFLSQFPDSCTREMVFGALMDMGFTGVFEIEKMAPLLIHAQQEWLAGQPEKGVSISAFCPAIVRLIQVRFPGLTNHLMLVKPPVDAAAWYCRQSLLDQGAREEEIGLFYFTPCAAKIAAVKSPVGESFSLINGVANLNAIYNKVLTHLNNKQNLQIANKVDVPLGPDGIRWALTQGEARHHRGRSLAIDGIQNVIEFLEKLENDDAGEIDFLELRACDQGCPGGILVSGNRFLITERMLGKSNQAMTDCHHATTEGFPEGIKDHLSLASIHPRPSLMLDTDMSRAMKKLEKVRNLMCYLPGFDCAACGAPSCQALAEDTVRGEANISDCVFIQRIMEKHHKLSPEHSLNIIEKIWGKDRLEKNCNKIGANNENF